MKISDNGYYTFQCEDQHIRFHEDMHDYAIMIDSQTQKTIHFSDYKLAKQESDRLNTLNIEGLDTRPLGIPWRIMLITWQDKNVLME